MEVFLRDEFDPESVNSVEEQRPVLGNSSWAWQVVLAVASSSRNYLEPLRGLSTVELFAT